MPRYKMKDRIIWITGATSGIGKALCDSLSAENTVIASGRSAINHIQNGTSNENIHWLAADVTKLHEMKYIANYIDRKFGALDMVICNAGDCQYLEPNHFDTEIIAKMLNVNFFGFINTLSASLPLLRKSNTPYIVAISSSSAYAGLPRAAAYSASKAAISQFMECLVADLKNEGFAFSIVHPGFVDTPLTQKNDFPMPFILSATECSKRIISGLRKQKYNIDFPKPLTILLKLLQHSPPAIRHHITAKLSRS